MVHAREIDVLPLSRAIDQQRYMESIKQSCKPVASLEDLKKQRRRYGEATNEITIPIGALIRHTIVVKKMCRGR